MDAHELRRKIKHGDQVADADLITGSATLSHDETIASRREFTAGLQRLEALQGQLAHWEEEVGRRRTRLCNAILSEVPDTA